MLYNLLPTLYLGVANPYSDLDSRRSLEANGHCGSKLFGVDALIGLSKRFKLRTAYRIDLWPLAGRVPDQWIVIDESVEFFNFPADCS